MRSYVYTQIKFDELIKDIYRLFSCMSGKVWNMRSLKFEISAKIITFSRHWWAIEIFSWNETESLYGLHHKFSMNIVLPSFYNSLNDENQKSRKRLKFMVKVWSKLSKINKYSRSARVECK